jgi:hypothetical protein
MNFKLGKTWLGIGLLLFFLGLALKLFGVLQNSFFYIVELGFAVILLGFVIMLKNSLRPKQIQTPETKIQNSGNFITNSLLTVGLIIVAVFIIMFVYVASQFK